MLHAKIKLFFSRLPSEFSLTTVLWLLVNLSFFILPVKVLSSAENIAVELATERACGWLSANISGGSFYLELGLLTCALNFFFLRSRDRHCYKVLGPKSSFSGKYAVALSLLV